MEKNDKISKHPKRQENLSLQLEKAAQKIVKLKSQNLSLTLQKNQIFNVFHIVKTLHEKVEKIFLIDDLYKRVIDTLVSDLSMDAAAFLKINCNSTKTTFLTYKGFSENSTLLDISCDFPKQIYSSPTFANSKSSLQKFHRWIKKYFGIPYFIWYPVVEDDNGILVLLIGNKSEDVLSKQPFSKTTLEILTSIISIFLLQRENIIKTEERYHQLFTHSPVSLWEEDASELNLHFDHLRKTGVKNFKAYFESHPEAVHHCASLIKVVDVNNASLRMYKAERKEDFFKGLNKIFSEKSYEQFKKILIAITEGKRYFEIEGIQKTFTGEEIYVMLCFSIVPGYEKTLFKVFISIFDITQRKNAEEALSNYKEELRYLSSKLVITEERERRRIASAIHDNIGQTLAVSKIKLEMLKKSLPSEEYVRFIDDIILFIDQALNNTRSLIFDLSPRILYDLGLEAAVETLLRKIREEHNIMCHYYDDGKNKPLNEDISIFLYRAIHELIINVVKHAKAKNLKVAIGKENNKIQIFVEDDGIGFDSFKLKSSYKNGFGLFNIKEELNYINGDIRIDSASGGGTKITVVAPLINSNEIIK